MTSIIKLAVSAIISTWRSHERKRMERRALQTIIHRQNDHLRRDVGLVTDEDFSRPRPNDAEHPGMERSRPAEFCGSHNNDNPAFDCPKAGVGAVQEFIRS